MFGVRGRHCLRYELDYLETAKSAVSRSVWEGCQCDQGSICIHTTQCFCPNVVLSHWISVSLQHVLNYSRDWITQSGQGSLQVIGSCQYPVNPVSCDHKAEREYTAVTILLVHTGNFIYCRVHLLWGSHHLPWQRPDGRYSKCPADSSILLCHDNTKIWGFSAIRSPLLLQLRLRGTRLSKQYQIPADDINLTKLWKKNQWAQRKETEMIHRATQSDFFLLLLCLFHFYQVNEEQPIITVLYVLSRLMAPASYTIRLCQLAFV